MYSMVELEVDDYKNLIKWFEMAFAKLPPTELPNGDRRTFWKLSFLAEDKINETRVEKGIDD
ncbi:MAG: hypothetical protein CL735_03965 [Chloroflexi bacterium]|nr:hypothetical protein [Chloroflexota bacterium]